MKEKDRTRNERKGSHKEWKKRIAPGMKEKDRTRNERKGSHQEWKSSLSQDIWQYLFLHIVKYIYSISLKIIQT